MWIKLIPGEVVRWSNGACLEGFGEFILSNLINEILTSRRTDHLLRPLPNGDADVEPSL